MKNLKKLFLTSFVLGSLVGCSGPQPLGPITGIKFEDGILSFDELAGATAYDICFKQGNEILYEDRIEGTTIDVDSLNLEGSIEFICKGYAEGATATETTFTFTSLATMGDVIIEAEDNLYNFGTGKATSNFRNNPMAHNGAYVGGLDDAGQGIYINYLSPFAGEFDVESYYCFEVTNPSFQQAHHDIVVNGTKQAIFSYTEKTGWGGASFNPAKATAKITLEKGWNTIAVYKNGDNKDNWGDFAEIDYIKIIGNGEKYNPDDLKQYGDRPDVFRLEAEMGSPRRKNKESGLYECKNPCIKDHDDKHFSNGFLMGNVESKYDGVEWHFDSPVKANYTIKLSYASGIFDGSKKARPTFIVTQQAVLLNKNIDFLDYPSTQMDDLPYTGWDNPTLAEQEVTLTLEKGDNFIYCLLMDGSGFFQIDYADLTFVSEIE